MSIGDLTEQEWRDYAFDPIGFVKDIGNATPDDWQGDVLETYIKHPLTAIRSCTGPGKDWTLSALTFHFMSCGFMVPFYNGLPGATDEPPKVIHTATDEDQLSIVLWTELKLWLDNSNGLSELFEWSATRIRHRSPAYRDTWFAAAQTSARRKDSGGTTHVGGSQGQHRANMLIGIDEAAHVDDAFFAAYLGTLSQAHNRLIAYSNPDKLSGIFYRIFHDKDVKPLWQRYTISGRQHTIPAEKGHKHFISARAAEGPNHNILIKTWGAKHPIVQTKVLGVHPTSSLPNTAYSWDEMQAARVQGRIIPAETDSVQIGVDVARFGDSETVYTIRRGRLFRQVIERKQSTDHIVDKIIDIAEAEPDLTTPEYGYRPWAMVDETGVGGGVVDGLRRRGYMNVRGVAFGGSPRHGEKYFNLAAEMWLEDAKDYFKCVHCGRYYEAHFDEETEGGVIVPAAVACPNFETECEIPDDDELTNQAIAREYFMADPKVAKGRTKIGRRAIRSKDWMRERGMPSPDRMDSFCLSCVRPKVARAS